jgi:hypothetical protein
VTNLRTYCRAYLLLDLRRFADWPTIADGEYDDFDDETVVSV